MSIIPNIYINTYNYFSKLDEKRDTIYRKYLSVLMYVFQVFLIMSWFAYTQNNKQMFLKMNQTTQNRLTIILSHIFSLSLEKSQST